MSWNHRPLLLAATLFLTMAPGPLWAKPPGHAAVRDGHPRQAAYYMGYTGRKWDADYGITRGRCQCDGTGAGNKVAIAVSAKPGHEFDQKDAACIGHALELARDRQRVTWTGKADLRYQLRPLAASVHDGLPCREFELIEGNHRLRQSACQREPGVWMLR